MLYWLYELTSLNILQYITVRAGIAFFVSFILSIFIIPKFIKWAKAKNAKQPIYNLAPKTHQKNQIHLLWVGYFLYVQLFLPLYFVLI